MSCKQTDKDKAKKKKHKRKQKREPIKSKHYTKHNIS